MLSRNDLRSVMNMPRLRTIRWGLLMLSVSVYTCAQNAPQSQATTPAPAFGQNAPILNPDNPPLSGLDEPSLDLHTATRSFVSPALQVSESADSNPDNTLSTSNVRSVSHVIGALDLQQFWPKSDFFLEYLGGASFIADPYEVKQLQALGAEGVTRWRTGMIKLRDAFSYLPDGSFDIGTGGGIPGLGIATGGMGTGGLAGTRSFNNGGFIGVGTIPRLSNTAILDVTQAISPRSAFTVAGGFSNAHFFHNVDGLVDSDQTTIQGGYSHLISRRDQLAAIYGFQLFRFPDNAGGQIYNHIFNIRWSHTISGRMSFIGGIGPQYTKLEFGNIVPRWSVSGRASLRYKFEHASIIATYEKYTSEGAGFFAGADTQVARLSIRRPLGRTYEVVAEAGFTHDKRLQPLGGQGVAGSTLDRGTAGAVLRKHIGRTYDVFAAYRFSEVDFSDAVLLDGSIGKLNQRHLGTIGLEWHPRPTKIE